MKVSNEPVRRNQIVEDKFMSVRMWMKEVQDEVWRIRTENGYKAHMRVSLPYKTKFLVAQCHVTSTPFFGDNEYYGIYAPKTQCHCEKRFHDCILFIFNKILRLGTFIIPLFQG